MENPASLGAVVRDRRLALGYSLGQLATKVNKTAASIRAWEKGESFPTESEAAALAGALDLDGDLLAELLVESEVWAAEPLPEVAVVDPWPGGKKGSAPSAEDDRSADESATDESAAAEPDLDEGAAAIPEDAAADEEAGPEFEDEVDTPVVADVDDDEPDDVGDAATEDDLQMDESIAAGASDGDLQADEVVVDSAGVIDDVIDGQEALDAAKASLADEEVSRPIPTADSTIHEAMTEAVPVVPAPVAVAAPESEPQLSRPAGDPFSVTRTSNPLVYWWDTVMGWYRAVFDPRRKWIYRVRFVLLLIAFYVMLRLLAWSGSELWDAIGEVLDSFSFSPTETPDVAN